MLVAAGGERLPYPFAIDREVVEQASGRRLIRRVGGVERPLEVGVDLGAAVAIVASASIWVAASESSSPAGTSRAA
ncbi:hypothetical protein ACIA5C_07095 [Actinoplanes sp. NPDC051343]|uniref:hypothetical protein n=1 Tax=Actinoplanes sp. NPDC051343 TaxID=3363906 RepID=UPI0037A5CAE9